MCVTLTSLYPYNGDGDFSVRLGSGYADMKDLTEILVGDTNVTKDYKVVNLDLGYRLFEDIANYPFDLFIRAGVSYFDELTRKDTLESYIYLKLYWKLDFWDNQIRLGVGEGISTTERVLEVEIIDETDPNTGNVGKTEHTLNYIELTVDFDLGLLIGVEELEDFYIGYMIKHRSGIFGAFDGVHGGSNYHLLTLEKNF